MDTSPGFDPFDLLAPVEEVDPSAPSVPVRMLNEFTYCPRLGYLEWAQGEWAASADTLGGEFVHRNVDREDRRDLPRPEGAKDDVIHARSLRLEDAALGLVGVLDLLEVEGDVATPVDYKRGKTPDVVGSAWDTDQVQLCAQGLLLRSAGFQCDRGVVYYAASKERITVEFDEALIHKTRGLIADFRRTASLGQIPPPLVESPKCVRCSLNSICLPDETNLLADGLPADEAVAPKKKMRLALVPKEDARPVIIVEQGARLGKEGERLTVELKGERLTTIKLLDVSQVCLFGNVQVTTQALGEMLDRDIPICYFSTNGWFRGVSTGFAHRNVEVRIKQYASASDPATALAIAMGFVTGKIRNGRTLLRRNLDSDPDGVVDRLAALAGEAERTASLESLLGLEGMAAKEYFAAFGKLLKAPFTFTTRNRRPPTDPVNAALSFLYAILCKECHIATQAAGLDPMLGFLHQPRYGRPSLALDLAEEFRPIVADSTVLSLINTGELADSHFVRRAGACALTPAGRKAVLGAWERRMSTEVTHPVFGYALSYRRVIALQARLLTRVLLGEIPAYPAFKTR